MFVIATAGQEIPAGVALKTCILCKVAKPLEAFSKGTSYAPTKKSRRYSYCRVCSNINARIYQSSVEVRARKIWNSARHRLPEGFSLTLDHVMREIERGHCRMTGVPFDLEHKSEHHRNPYSPSLDKIDPCKPYTDENTRLVIWQYNAFKGELSDAETLDIARKLIARHPP